MSRGVRPLAEKLLKRQGMSKRFALFTALALLSGCRASYVVRAPLLGAAMAELPEHPEQVVPAERLDGTPVLLRTETIDAARVASVAPSPADHLELAAVLQQRGAQRLAARQLALFMARPELRNADPAQAAQVSQAIHSLDAKRGALPVGQLALASMYPSQAASPSLTLRVRPTNRVMSAAQVLGWMSAAFGVGGIISFATLGRRCVGDLCTLPAFAAGISFTSFAGMLGITAGILALSGRRTPEAKPHVVVVPWAASSSGGLMLSGAF
jgi:hypothetical protein